MAPWPNLGHVDYFGTAVATVLPDAVRVRLPRPMTAAESTIPASKVLVSHGTGAVGPWVCRLADLLRPAGVQVKGVSGAAAVVDWLRRLRPGVVVVDDVSLTGAGWGLLRRIRRLEPTLPCLMVVDRAEPPVLNRALRLSAYSVFESPVDAELMGRMVRRLLAGRLGPGGNGGFDTHRRG